MKKFITTLMMMAMFAVMVPMFATSADAQTRRVYRTRSYAASTYERPSFYRRHRNVINMAIGTGAGALIGGLIGGKKGALLGTAAGAAGSAIYTYKIKPKQRRY
ncbi:MAG: glycine zipper 2TM domain-containing protein [Pyrinomonadaceae bacterium]